MNLLVRVRELHQRIAPFVLLPLFVTVFSGVGYRLARDWCGASREQVHWLMTLHEGGVVRSNPRTSCGADECRWLALDADHWPRSFDRTLATTGTLILWR